VAAQEPIQRWGNSTQIKRLAALVLATAALGVAAVAAQQVPDGPPPLPPPGGARTPRASELVRAANDCFRAGDYETADQLCQQANQNRQQLNPAEQKDLDSIMRTNSAALKQSREGAVQLQQASGMLQQGKLQEAATLVRALNANQYLRQTDKVQLARLNEQIKAQGVVPLAGSADGKGPSPIELPRDYRLLVRMARTAFEHHDLDKAEMYCHEAKKVHPSWQYNWMLPFSDNEDKVLEDVRNARMQQAATKAAQNARNEMVGLPDRKDASVVAGPATNSSSPAPQVSKETLEVRAFLEQGKEACKRNDLVTARKCADQARAKMDPNSWLEQRSYEQLIGEIQRRQGQIVQTGASMEVSGGPSVLPPPLPPGVQGPETKTVDAKNARSVLLEARGLCAQSKFDDAEKLCAQVAAVKVSWGYFEDNPDKLRKDITASRQKSDKAESIKLLAEARKLLATGNYQEARLKTWRARQLHGPYGVMELGDRPDRLLSEIEAAEAKQKTPGQTPPTGIAREGSKTGPPGGPADLQGQANAPSPAALALKQRAVAMLDEARALSKKGELMEAQAKARQAQVVALEAQKAGCGFGPLEESPEVFANRLAAQANARIDSLMHVAEEQSKGDSGSRQKAVDSLKRAREMAMLFGLDVRAIDLKIGELQGPPANLIQTASASGGPAANHGQELLDHARTEIRAGRFEIARRLAEDAFDPKFGAQTQKDAEAVLRSIDMEEFNRRSLDSEQAFLNAYAAYMRKDYVQAQRILSNVDDRLLSQERVARLREIAMDPNMQPADKQQPVIQQLQAQTIQTPGQTPGQAHATDVPGFPGVLKQAPTSDHAQLDSVKAMDKVVFDKAVKDGLAVQREALQKVTNKDYDGAIELLRNYKTGLEELRLNQDQMARLTPAIDRQINNYQWRKEQDASVQKMANLGSDTSGTKHEQQRTLQKLEREKEMARVMDDFNTLIREHKFKEAYVQAEHAVELDPDNVVAREALIFAKMRMRVNEQEEISKYREKYNYEADNFDKLIYLPTNAPVAFDEEITKKNRNRKGFDKGIQTEYHDPVERRLDRILKEKDVTINVVDQALYQVINDIKEIVGENNIVFDDQALEKAGIRKDRLITVSLNKVTLRSALNIILKKADLTHMIHDQSIVITTNEYARGDLKTVVYSVTDLVTPVPDHPSLMQQLWDSRIKNSIRNYEGQNNYSGGYVYNGPRTLQNGQPVGYPAGPENTLGGRPPKPEGTDRQDELLMRLIKSTIAPNTWADVGGQGTIQYYPIGGALIVGQQTQDIQEQIVDLLNALRRLQDLEVAIELRLVAVSEAFFEFMGVNFDMNITHGSTSVEPILTSGVFAPNGFINKFEPASFWSGLTPAGTFTPDLGVPIRTSSFDFAIPPFGGYPGTLGQDGGISLGLAFLSDIQVFMFLEAAQGDRRANVMQAPKVTVFNGQTASVFVGDVLTFLDSINVNQIAGQTVFTPQQNVQGNGVGLTVQPIVSADRRFVRLNLSPQLTNLVSTAVPLLPVQQVVPQLLYDNISPPQPQVFTLFFQQPANQTITVNTTVVVPDGGTVLMGGLKTLVEARNEFGPPVLSKIPYISRLFKNIGYGREAQSLMVMVTARIIINEEEEQEFLGNLPRIPR
jgi:type II secretory pathway component GspD/PulD (secretin)